MITLTFLRGAIEGALAMGFLFGSVALFALSADRIEKCLMARRWAREGAGLPIMMLVATTTVALLSGLVAVVKEYP